MTGKDLFREIGNMDEKYVAEAQETKRAAILSPVFRKTLATAACLVVCLGIYAGVQQAGRDSGATQCAPNMSMDSAESAGSANGTNSGGSIDAETADTFLEDLVPVENQMTADAESKSESVMESLTQDAQEEADGVALESEMVEEVLLDEALWVQAGQEAVDAFLEKTEQREAAELPMCRTAEDGMWADYSLVYTGEKYIVTTGWYYPDEAEETIAGREATYAYLKVFEDTTPQGDTYYVLGVGNTEDFSLRDLEIGSKDTLIILRYVR